MARILKEDLSSRYSAQALLGLEISILIKISSSSFKLSLGPTVLGSFEVQLEPLWYSESELKMKICQAGLGNCQDLEPPQG